MNECNLNENKPVCIYAIRCKETGRIYIGSTCDLETRLKNHFRTLKDGCKRITSYKRKSNEKHPFQVDFDNFGMESFEAFIIEQNIPKFLRDEREEYWIDRYNSANSQYGYNLYKCCNNGKIFRETSFPVPVHIGLPPMLEVGFSYEK